MKKTIIYAVTSLFSLAFVPKETKAASELFKAEMKGDSTDVQMNLITRLNEIEKMDKSTLSWNEKRALRKEVRSSEKELRKIGGGIYISAGAVILIIILILIFL